MNALIYQDSCGIRAEFVRLVTTYGESLVEMEARVGIEPAYTELQSAA